MATPEQVAKALPVTHAEIVPIYAAPDLSILKVVWGPDMKIPADNHLMWAAIGLYGGQEDNTLFRRKGNGIIPSGGHELARRRRCCSETTRSTRCTTRSRR